MVDMSGLRNKSNILQLLYHRQISVTPPSVKTTIIRRLVESENSYYIPLYETERKRSVLYTQGKFFLNYSTCFSLALNENDCVPRDLYSWPEYIGPESIIDALVYSGPVHDLVGNGPECHRPFFLTLSDNRWLRVYDNTTGILFHEVYLGNLKYNHCDWVTYGKQLVLTTELSIRQKDPRTRRTQTPPLLATLAVFTVLPLQFVAVLEINRSVFGDTCNHVKVYQDMLFIGTGTSADGSVEIYNFSQVLEENLIEECSLNVPSVLLDGERVGTYPTGLPLNCIPEKRPSALTKVECCDCTVHFMGYPSFCVSLRYLGDEIHVRNIPGSIMRACLTPFCPCSIVFLGTSSRLKIIQSEHGACFRDVSDSTEKQENTQSCDGSGNSSDGDDESTNTNTSEDSDLMNVFSYDFDEDLGLFAILVSDRCDPCCQGRVIFFDSETGNKVKTIELSLELHILYEYSLTFERDNLVIIGKYRTGCVGFLYCLDMSPF